MSGGSGASGRRGDPEGRVQGRILGAALGLGLLAGCAAAERQPPTASQQRQAQPSCPAAEENPAETICRADQQLRSLRSRFRVDVKTSQGSQTAEGILLVKNPGAIRLKLFGPGGMTVHDALWVGNATRVHGYVRRPLRGEPIDVELGPKDVVTDPEAELSLALWALFQARCAGPVQKSNAPGWFVVDPRSAHAIQRWIRVGPEGLEEEIVVREVESPPRRENLDARYAKLDCSGPLPLPRSIELVSVERGWRAKVSVIEQEVNPALDPALFAIPERAPAAASR